MSRHQWIVDHVEEHVVAIEEDGERLIRVPRHLLPSGVAEGDVFAVEREEQEGETRLLVRPDPAAKRRALRRSREQVRMKPPKKDPGGDIEL